MNEIKRKFNSHLCDNEGMKKSRHQNISINSIENLSNEIFYEIFDYLNAYHINEAFSNLNHRFQQLLTSSSLLLKVKMNHSTSEEICMKNYHKILRHHKHQIISICPLITDDNHILSTLNINSSFIHLQSLVCWLMKADLLRLIIPRLESLPSLISLSINTGNALDDLYEIYDLIFDLTKLKSFKFTAISPDNSEIVISLANANDNSINPIEYLTIDHPYTLNELVSIISYTPQLYHLSFIEIGDYVDDQLNIEILSSNFLPNLTRISMESFYIEFDQLKIFLRKLPSKLKYFSFKTLTEQKRYLNAKRWQELILKYLPNLEKFSLYYSVDYRRDFGPRLYEEHVNQFISSFWIKKKWIYEIEIDFDEIIYSIRPYKKRWYDEDNDIIDYSKSSRLTLNVSHNEKFPTLLLRNSSRILPIVKIYHLEICIQISNDVLIEILKPLNYLDSLNLSSLLLLLKDFEKNINFQCDSIRKIFLEILNDINELNFLMKICPQMTYLKIHLINNINIQTLLRYILRKIQNQSNIYLRLLHIRVPALDDKIIDRLIQMMNSEELLFNYTIKRILDNIYLQWT